LRASRTVGLEQVTGSCGRKIEPAASVHAVASPGGGTSAEDPGHTACLAEPGHAAGPPSTNARPGTWKPQCLEVGSTGSASRTCSNRSFNLFGRISYAALALASALVANRMCCCG